MKLLLGMTLLALITGIHSQFAPSAEDIACVGQYIAENPDDEAVLNVVNNCQEDACGNEDCLSGLTTLYSRCNSNYDLRACKQNVGIDMPVKYRKNWLWDALRNI